MASSGNPPLLLTNYRGGGIGDFGLTLEAHLRSRLNGLTTEETSIDGRGSFGQATRAAVHPGLLIANLGLTAWGRSGPRNLVGFTAIGTHRALGYPTKVIVHHAIEIFDLRETGYAVSPLVLKGAHLALAQVKDCELIVFSPRLRDMLADLYGARRVWLVPHPGELGRKRVSGTAPGRAKVVHAGYWAPYKGIDRFIEIAGRMKDRAEFVLVGRPHSALSSDTGFRQKVDEWTALGQRAGVRMTGFLSHAELDDEFSTLTVGLLPYTSVSGASSSFNLFAERGIPVVATDLPEFRYLETLGAGVLIAPPTVDGLSSAIARLLGDRELWLALSKRQVEFVEKFSWDRFVGTLLAAPVGPHTAGSNPPGA